MNKFLLVLLFLFSSNVFSEIDLRKKINGVWSPDCANPKIPRTHRSTSILGDDEGFTKNGNGDITGKTKFKIQTITETKFKMSSTNSLMDGKKVLKTFKSESIIEFLVDGRGINYSKFRVIDALATYENGETLQIAKNGYFLKKESDGSFVPIAEAIIEKCLN
jgi:hypothetical protein